MTANELKIELKGFYRKSQNNLRKIDDADEVRGFASQLIKELDQYCDRVIENMNHFVENGEIQDEDCTEDPIRIEELHRENKSLLALFKPIREENFEDSERMKVVKEEMGALDEVLRIVYRIREEVFQEAAEVLNDLQNESDVCECCK